MARTKQTQNKSNKKKTKPKKKPSDPVVVDPKIPSVVKDVSVADRKAAIMELNILYQPKEPPTYGNMVAKVVYMPNKTRGYAPKDFICAWANTHTEDEMNKYHTDWLSTGVLPEIKFTEKNKHSELQNFVYIELKDDIAKESKVYTSRAMKNTFDGDIQTPPVDIEQWGPEYREGIKFAAHLHVVY
jgi:hypothetical protein